MYLQKTINPHRLPPRCIWFGPPSGFFQHFSHFFFFSFPQSLFCVTWKNQQSASGSEHSPLTLQWHGLRLRGHSHSVSDHLVWPLHSADLASDVRRSNIFADNKSFSVCPIPCQSPELVTLTDGRSMPDLGWRLLLGFWEMGKSAPR